MRTTLTIAVLISLLICTSLAESDGDLGLDDPKPPAEAMKDSNRGKDLEEIEAKKIKITGDENPQETDEKILTEDQAKDNQNNPPIETNEDSKVQGENESDITNEENSEADEENENHDSIKKINEDDLVKDDTLENYKMNVKTDTQKETSVLDDVLKREDKEDEEKEKEQPSKKIEIDDTNSDLPIEDPFKFEVESKDETELPVQKEHSIMPDQKQEEIVVHPERTNTQIEMDVEKESISNDSSSSVKIENGIPAGSRLNEIEASESNDQNVEHIENVPPQQMGHDNTANLQNNLVNPKFQKVVMPPIEIDSQQNVGYQGSNINTPVAGPPTFSNVNTPVAVPPAVFPDELSHDPQVASIQNLDSDSPLSFEDKPEKQELTLTSEEVDELLELKKAGKLSEMIQRSHELKQQQLEQELAQKQDLHDNNYDVENESFDNDFANSEFEDQANDQRLNPTEQSEVQVDNPYKNGGRLEELSEQNSFEKMERFDNSRHLQADTRAEIKDESHMKAQLPSSVSQQKNPYKNVMIAVILLSLGLTWINRRMIAGLFIKRKRRGYMRVQEDDDQCSFSNIINRFNDDGGNYVQVDVTPTRVKSPDANGWEEDNWEDWGEEDEKWDETA